MESLLSQADPHCADFQSNAQVNRELVDELRGHLDAVSRGGSQKSRQRHIDRGRMLPRERIDRLIDVGSPFFELSHARGEWLLRRRSARRRNRHRNRRRVGQALMIVATTPPSKAVRTTRSP